MFGFVFVCLFSPRTYAVFVTGHQISEYASQEGLKLNSKHQLLFYADGVNISGGRIHTIKQKTEALIVTSKEAGLEENRDHFLRQAYGQKSWFRYLGTMLTYQISLVKILRTD